MNDVLKKIGADKTPDQIKDAFNDGKRVIGISSGKGGVGKSTVTSLLALAYAKKGKKVGIVDADIWGYSIPKILGAKFPPIPFSNRIFPSKINDLNVISMEYFVKQDEAVIWRGPMLHKAIEQFLFEVILGRYRYFTDRYATRNRGCFYFTLTATYIFRNNNCYNTSIKCNT